MVGEQRLHPREVGVGGVGRGEVPLEKCRLTRSEVCLDGGLLAGGLQREVLDVGTQRDRVLHVLLVRAALQLRGHVEGSQQDRHQRGDEERNRDPQLRRDGH